jgi:hypothetical protein
MNHFLVRLMMIRLQHNDLDLDGCCMFEEGGDLYYGDCPGGDLNS